MRIATVLLTLSALAAATPAMAAQNGYEAILDPSHRPILGVQQTPVPLSVQEQQGLSPNEGVYVQSVYGNTAAAIMGLQPGDVITSINGAPISSMTDLRNEVGINQVGDPIEVTIRRNGQDQSALGQLQKWPDSIPYDPIDPAMEQRFRDWQDRRLARMQDEVEQLRQQAQDMARQSAAEAAAKNDQLFGISEKPLLGADGLPLSWRFRYTLAAPVDHATPPVAANDAALASAPAERASAVRTWRFTWKLLSTRPAQEL